jgi:Cu(I)/Ag(I) efflux system membrane fusion protein
MSERNVKARGGAKLAVLFVIVALAIGFWIGRGTTPASDGGAPAAASDAALWTCSMHPQVIQDHPGLCPICHMALTPLTTRGGCGAVAVDAAVVQAMGLRTARVVRVTEGRGVRALGRLVERDFDHLDVNLRVSGWIETLVANVNGMHVARGDTLFTLSSPELSVAVDELIAARKQRDADRERKGSIGAELFGAASRKLVYLGLPEDEIARLAALDAAPATVEFKSPWTAHVAELDVYAGSSVEAGMRVMRLARNEVLWLDLRVRTSALSRVGVGSDVRVTTDSAMGREFAGRVTFVHPHVDMESQTALVRAEIDNADGLLREGQNARAEIAPLASVESLAVPRSAVIDTGERQVLFVALGDGRFEPRALVLGGDLEDGLVAIEKGVAEGEDVVASGQFLLDTESRLRESLAKFLPSGTDVTVVERTERPEWAAGVDEIVERYLAIADQLGRTQESDTPVDVRPFVDAVRALSTKSAGDARVRAVLTAAEPLAGANLDTQRNLFKAASDALLDLLAAVPPSEQAGGGKLYVVKCPMAPGRWLQRDPGVKNPYYAEIMKECGEVVGPLRREQGEKR